ncbi:unnamed protein product [Trifolium pratense]|uniref:Uncharacterized protein n=1 Tax=Trifolium pratense TaxID=57577 RepID=A0ACB0IFD8_TRIPR|nr:unnamed protein product [Trifolium pratense]
MTMMMARTTLIISLIKLNYSAFKKGYLGKHINLPSNFITTSFSHQILHDLLLSILIIGNQILPLPSSLLLRRRRFFSSAIVVAVSPLIQLPLLLALPSTFKRSFTSSGITCPSSATFVPESDSSSTFLHNSLRQASTRHILTPFGMREYKVHLDIPCLRLRWRRWSIRQNIASYKK